MFGNVEDVFDELLSKRRINAVYTSTPLSWSERELVDSVKSVCRRYGVMFIEVYDNVLSSSLIKHPVSSFSSFYKSWVKNVEFKENPATPNSLSRKLISYESMELHELSLKLGLKTINSPYLNIKWGFERLHSFNFREYGRIRDYPFLDSTSRLSHFINLGVLSIREIYGYASRFSEEYVRQLAWREFYYALWIKYPWMRDVELKPYTRGLDWGNDGYLIDCFKKGRTGYPIVDAGVIQLLNRGWVHNRVRLIMANFLVKILDVDWRIGVEFFKNNLVDYDEVLNVGNWQWAASVGVDPIPIRLFNPVKQAEKYDPLCLYVKKYIPELEGEECRAIHDPVTYRLRGYYEPIMDYREAVKAFLMKVRKRIMDWRSRKAG